MLVGKGRYGSLMMLGDSSSVEWVMGLLGRG